MFKIGLFSNASLNKAILLSLALLLVVIYVPFLDPIFHTIMLTLSNWAIIVPLALVPFAAAEIDKALRSLGKKSKQS